jgi:iron complex transport system permease protein
VKWLVGILVGAVLIVLALFFQLGLGGPWDPEIFWEIRLPRVLLGFFVGAALSFSGLLLQNLFQNPLSDPYTLGISSGASLGAISASMVGGVGWSLNLGGALGSFFFSFVLMVAFRFFGGSLHRLLLFGILLGLLGSSAFSFLLILSDPSGIQRAIYWLMGDLARATQEGWVVMSLLVALTFCWIWIRSRDLDALRLGPDFARSVGVRVSRIRAEVLLVTSFLTAASVVLCGMIGFVGLMVPHYVRRIVGSSHRPLASTSLLVGGLLVIVSDTLSRSFFAGAEIPVGVILTFLGVPTMFWIGLKRNVGSSI